MPWNFAKLQRELDRKRLPRTAHDAFLQRPQLGVDNLMTFLRSGNPTAYQAIHGLRLLPELTVQKSVTVDSQAVAEVIERYLGHVDPDVKSSAASSLLWHCMHALVFPDLRLPLST